MPHPAVDDHNPAPAADGEAQAEKPTGNAVFISADDRVLHVSSVDRLLLHLESDGTDVLAVRNQLPEIYDSSGRRLAVTEGPAGGPELIRMGAENTIDKQLLVDRIRAALARMQVAVHTHEVEALRTYRVPVVDGELLDVLAALAGVFALPGDNVGHAAGSCHAACPHPHS